MDLQKKLEKKIEEYNVLNTQIEQALATRAQLMGQIQLLQELQEEEKALLSKPKKRQCESMTEIALETQQEIAEVLRLRDDENLTFAKIAEILGFSETTAKRRYKAGMLLGAIESEDGELEDFPQTDDLDLPLITDFLPEDRGPIERFDPLVAFGDAMVAMDFHIPLHDPALINRMLSCAAKNNINQLIIAGDYFNMEAFGSFLPHQPEASLQQERYDANVIMKTLLRTFGHIYFIWGNHDFRLVRKLGFKKSFEECMKWMLSGLDEDEMERISFSDLDYMHYWPDGKGTGRKYRICHPRNFSSVPLTVARKLATKHDCSVITGHSHHFAIGAAQNGWDLAIEGGGFFSKERTEYIQKTTNHHEWVQGFTFFKKGIPTLVGPVLGNHLQYQGVKNETS